MESKITRKICGTCLFWDGCREPLISKKKVAIIDEVGKCQCPISSKSGQIRKKDLNCKFYENFMNN